MTYQQRTVTLNWSFKCCCTARATICNCIRWITLDVVVQFHPLETIEEELEQADHTTRRHTRDDDEDEEEEDGDCQVPVEVEAQPAEVQSEEDGVVFGVMRPRRKSSCQGSRSSGGSSASFPPLRVRPSLYEKSHISSKGKKKRARTYQKSTNGTLRKKVSLWCSFSMRFKDPRP